MEIDDWIERLEEDVVSLGSSLQTLDLMLSSRGSRGNYSEGLFSLQRSLEELHEAAFDLWEKSQESTEE